MKHLDRGRPARLLRSFSQETIALYAPSIYFLTMSEAIERQIQHETDLRDKATEMLNDGMEPAEVIDSFTVIAEALHNSFNATLPKVH